MKQYKPRGAVVAADLGVTSREAEGLKLEALAPAAVREDRKARKVAHKAAKEAKRKEVDDLLKASGGLGVKAIARKTGQSPQYVSARKARLRRLDELPLPSAEQVDMALKGSK